MINKKHTVIFSIFLFIFLSCAGLTVQEYHLEQYQSRVFLDFDIKHESLKKSPGNKDIAQASKLGTFVSTNDNGITFTSFNWVDNEISFAIVLAPYSMVIGINNRTDGHIRLLWNYFIFNGPNGEERFNQKHKVLFYHGMDENSKISREAFIENNNADNVRVGPGLTTKSYAYPSLVGEYRADPHQSPYPPFKNFIIEEEEDNTYANRRRDDRAAAGKQSLTDVVTTRPPDRIPRRWVNTNANGATLFRTYDDSHGTDMYSELVKAKKKYLEQNYSILLSIEMDGVVNDYNLSFRVEDIKISKKINIRPLPKVGEKLFGDNYPSSQHHQGGHYKFGNKERKKVK